MKKLFIFTSALLTLSSISQFIFSDYFSAFVTIIMAITVIILVVFQNKLWQGLNLFLFLSTLLIGFYIIGTSDIKKEIIERDDNFMTSMNEIYK